MAYYFKVSSIDFDGGVGIADGDLPLRIDFRILKERNASLIELSDMEDEFITDYITDEYGYCVNGLSFEICKYGEGEGKVKQLEEKIKKLEAIKKTSSEDGEGDEGMAMCMETMEKMLSQIEEGKDEYEKTITDIVCKLWMPTMILEEEPRFTYNPETNVINEGVEGKPFPMKEMVKFIDERLDNYYSLREAINNGYLKSYDEWYDGLDFDLDEAESIYNRYEDGELYDEDDLTTTMKKWVIDIFHNEFKTLDDVKEEYYGVCKDNRKLKKDYEGLKECLIKSLTDMGMKAHRGADMKEGLPNIAEAVDSVIKELKEQIEELKAEIEKKDKWAVDAVKDMERYIKEKDDMEKELDDIKGEAVELKKDYEKLKENQMDSQSKIITQIVMDNADAFEDWVSGCDWCKRNDDGELEWIDEKCITGTTEYTPSSDEEEDETPKERKEEILNKLASQLENPFHPVGLEKADKENDTKYFQKVIDDGHLNEALFHMKFTEPVFGEYKNFRKFINEMNKPKAGCDMPYPPPQQKGVYKQYCETEEESMELIKQYVKDMGIPTKASIKHFLDTYEGDNEAVKFSKKWFNSDRDYMIYDSVKDILNNIGDEKKIKAVGDYLYSGSQHIGAIPMEAMRSVFYIVSWFLNASQSCVVMGYKGVIEFGWDGIGEWMA